MMETGRFKENNHLTQQQCDKAKDWYEKHQSHVRRLVSSTENNYPPTDIEDKNNPAIWKAEHWRWLLYPIYRKN